MCDMATTGITVLVVTRVLIFIYILCIYVFEMMLVIYRSWMACRCMCVGVGTGISRVEIILHVNRYEGVYTKIS